MLEQKIEELCAAVATLTEVMQAFAAAAPTGGGDSGAEATDKPRRRRSKAAEPAAEEVTIDDVRAVAKQIIDDGDADAVKAILKKHKLGKLTDAKPAQYPALKDAFEAHLAEAGEGDDGDGDDLID